MKKRKYNGNYFLMYESIQELPVDRFFKFNLQMALDAGIGGTMNDVMARNNELRQFISAGKRKEALQALSNMENSIMVAMSEITPESNAFVCLVYECNGEKVTDLSQEGMSRYLKKWGERGLTYYKIKGLVAEVKKKFSIEIGHFFPSVGNSPQIIERGGMLKRRTMAALHFIQGKIKESEVRKYDDILLQFITPLLYYGHKGVEVQRTNGFEDAMVIIRRELNVTPDMTAHQFLKHSETVKEIIANRKKNKKIR